MVSENFGTPVGMRKLKMLRSTDIGTRAEAAGAFVRHVIEFLPPAATVTYMPSTSRRTARSDPRSISATVLDALSTVPAPPRIIEPITRVSPVPSVAETRRRDPELLVSTLEATPTAQPPDTVYVIDDMVATGATFVAFRTALHRAWPNVRPVLLAWVNSSPANP